MSVCMGQAVCVSSLCKGLAWRWLLYEMTPHSLFPVWRLNECTLAVVAAVGGDVTQLPHPWLRPDLAPSSWWENMNGTHWYRSSSTTSQRRKWAGQRSSLKPPHSPAGCWSAGSPLAVVVITLSSGQQQYCYGARTSLNWPAEWSGFWWWWELHSSRWSIPEHGDLHKICTSFTLSCLMSADSWGVLYHICIIIFLLFEFENWSNSFQYEEKCRSDSD